MKPLEHEKYFKPSTMPSPKLVAAIEKIFNESFDKFSPAMVAFLKDQKLTTDEEFIPCGMFSIQPSKLKQMATSPETSLEESKLYIQKASRVFVAYCDTLSWFQKIFKDATKEKFNIDDVVISTRTRELISILSKFLSVKYEAPVNNMPETFRHLLTLALFYKLVADYQVRSCLPEIDFCRVELAAMQLIDQATFGTPAFIKCMKNFKSSRRSANTRAPKKIKAREEVLRIYQDKVAKNPKWEFKSDPDKADIILKALKKKGIKRSVHTIRNHDFKELKEKGLL